MIQLYTGTVIIYVKDEEAANCIERGRFDPVTLFIRGHKAVIIESGYNPEDIALARNILERDRDGDDSGETASA